jgi:polar amino acid transport system substrate-binding protein
MPPVRCALASLVATAALMSIPGSSSAQSSVIAPTGTLRVAFLGTNPVHGRVDAKTGTVTGPVPDLVAELAKRHGIPFRLLPAPNAAGVIGLVQSGEADAGVLAYEAARAREVDFAGGFAVMLNTYVVRADSPLKTVTDADRAGLRIGVVRGQTQELYLSASLKQARLAIVDALPPPAELQRLVVSRELDAYAVNTQRAEDAVAASGGQLRALSGSYVDVEQSFVVKPGNSAAAAVYRAFVGDVIRSGLVKAALDRAGLATTTGVARVR